MEQQITITAKCPKCKKKKVFTEKPTFTPHCDVCFFPLVVDKVQIKTVKSK